MKFHETVLMPEALSLNLRLASVREQQFHTSSLNAWRHLNDKSSANIPRMEIEILLSPLPNHDDKNMLSLHRHVPNNKISVQNNRLASSQFCICSVATAFLALCYSDTPPLAISWHYAAGEEGCACVSWSVLVPAAITVSPVTRLHLTVEKHCRGSIYITFPHVDTATVWLGQATMQWADYYNRADSWI